MKILADENVAYAEEAFSQFGEVILKNGRSITRDDLKETDILVVRSVTNVNRYLLEGTPVKFVGTTTIGFDHFDIPYLEEKGITYTNASGCNSQAVAEYVLTALVYEAAKTGKRLEGSSIGIVGVGNIGSKVNNIAKILGMTVVLNDPPKQRETGSTEYKSLEEALTCDYVTFHVPLNKEGADKTVHLLNKVRIDGLKPGAVVINSSRGQVADNQALAERIAQRGDVTAIMDVWENEPALNKRLLELSFLATPHIAGYTLEGKVNGTKIIYDKLCAFLGENPVWSPRLPGVENPLITAGSYSRVETALHEVMLPVYPIVNDTLELKRALTMPGADIPAYFDKLRKNYKLRREVNNYSVAHANKEINELLHKLGFRYL